MRKIPMYNFDFSFDEYERIFKRCVFNETELEIIRLKRESRSNIYISQYLNISEASLSRQIRKIAKKIMREI